MDRFFPGVIEATGNPLDVALGSNGFFTVNGPKGPLYTRNGSLRILPTGELANSDGYPLRSTGGSTINVGAGKQINITKEGLVQQDGQSVGQLEVVDFKFHPFSAESRQREFSEHGPEEHPHHRPQSSMWSRASLKAPMFPWPTRPCASWASCGNLKCCKRLSEYRTTWIRNRYRKLRA